MREESCTFSFRQRWEKAKTGDAASRMALSICETDNITVITFCNYAVMVKCKSIARKIRDMLKQDRRFRHIRVGVNPPRTGKDYNEKLLCLREQGTDCQQQSRHRQAAISI